MNPSVALAATLAVLLAACSSDIEPGSEGAGGGAGTGGSGSGTGGKASSTTDGTGGSGGEGQDCSSGAPGCSFDETCAQMCESDGLSCAHGCGSPSEVLCFAEPGPPDEGGFACSYDENCTADEACVSYNHSVPDACGPMRCEALPYDCVSDPSCDCLAPFLDEASDLSCDDEAGLFVRVSDDENPDGPWDAPWCGGSSCEGEEHCWACTIDGGTEVSDYTCDLEDPTAFGAQSCLLRW